MLAVALRRPGLAGPLCALAALGLVLAEAHAGSWYESHEHLRYPVLVEHFYQAMKGGAWWPRWLPDLHGGYGYPEFVFYQPLFFFVATPFRWLFDDAVTACWGAVWVSLTLGAWGARRLADPGSHPKLGALGAVGFLLVPYVSVNWLIRCDLAELLAMALFPWALSAYLALLRPDQPDSPQSTLRPVSQLAISLALILLAHPIVGICAGLLLALPVPVLLLGSRTRARILPLAAAGACALLLSSPYLLPLAANRSLVRLDHAFEVVRATEHVVLPQQFLESSWDFGCSTPLGTADGMPFRLGGLWLGFAVIGLIAGRRRREVQLLGLLLTLTVLAMTPLAQGLWTLPPFSMMQFPWRLLSLAVGLELALLRGWVVSPQTQSTPILGSPSARMSWVSVAVLVALVGWSPEQFNTYSRTAQASELVRSAVREARATWNTEDQGELAPLPPKTRPASPRGKRPLYSAERGARVHMLDSNPHHPTAEVWAKAETRVTLRQSYFPGYEVHIDGTPVPESTLKEQVDRFGLITFTVRPRSDGAPRVVTARYTAPPQARLGSALSLLTALGLFCAAAWSRRAAAREGRQSSASSIVAAPQNPGPDDRARDGNALDSLA